MWGALARGIVGGVRSGVGLLSGAPRAIRTGVAVGSGVAGTAVATDLVLIPAAEGVLNRDLPGGHYTRDALAEVGNSIGNTIGAVQAAVTTGIPEGAARQLLGTSDEDSKTIGLIVVGGFALLLVLSLTRGR
ncbi:MAG: hypothetical protein AMXMBFR23_03170 [Chloroflexota bacterium]